MMYGLCDCNNFFASCERVFRPDLEGRPVIVLSNNDGCVVARSNEAKKLGIPMGIPAFEIKDLIRTAGITVFSANFALYGDLSHRVMDTLHSFVPNIEIYSIDEAFFDLSGFEKPDELAHRIRCAIKQNVGIPVSIGISPTKTLAKIASKLAKSYPKLEGCCYMHRPEDIAKVLKKFPLNDVWGIGRKHWKRFSAMGITTAQQFIDLPENKIRELMGVTGIRTWRELQGIPCIAYETNPANKQQISISRSFPKEVFKIDELECIISEFISQAATKLRAQRSSCLEVGVFIYTNRHHENDPQHCEGVLHTFAEPTNDTLVLSKHSRMLLNRIFRKGYGYKRAGVWLSEIVQTEEIQPSLFEDSAMKQKNEQLMATLDKVNKTYGRGTLKLGAEGTNFMESSKMYWNVNILIYSNIM